MESKLVSITIGGEVIDLDDDGKVIAKHMINPKEVMPGDAIQEIANIIQFVETRTAELKAQQAAPDEGSTTP